MILSVSLQTDFSVIDLTWKLTKECGVGKLPDNYPQYRGHTAAVLDTDFHPFNDYVIASGAEDSKVMIWNIPEKYNEEEQEDIEPVLKLSGHGRYELGMGDTILWTSD